MKYNSKQWTMLGVSTFIGLFAGIGSAFAYDKAHPGGFQPYPATVNPWVSFAAESITSFKNAAATWNNARAGTLINIGSTTSNTTYPNDNDLNQVTKGNRGTNEYLMQTKYTSTGLRWTGLWYANTIYEADIDINGSYAWHTGGAADFYDVQGVFTHELGHLLGLGHSDVATATMWPTIGKGNTSWRTLDEDDISGIVDIY
ncbi:matrixin family metalloprotease [Paenibacillus typhae]|uniref:matrixin family metalloprotease n=1 Tax=Paenibacillus typhae TaxID=1174501 RepID=UPI001C8EB1EC|nr:matrixin family metalloprotease [Paenibacillus typhae]MBY0011223.1 matrixin family metalloprotease [Paenibacillus typhae]